jgi:hypothetical protein
MEELYIFQDIIQEKIYFGLSTLREMIPSMYHYGVDSLFLLIRSIYLFLLIDFHRRLLKRELIIFSFIPSFQFLNFLIFSYLKVKFGFIFFNYFIKEKEYFLGILFFRLEVSVKIG